MFSEKFKNNVRACGLFWAGRSRCRWSVAV